MASPLTDLLEQFELLDFDEDIPENPPVLIRQNAIDLTDEDFMDTEYHATS